MPTLDERPALGASHEVPAGSTSGHNVRAGTSGLKVPARSTSAPDVRRCVTATAVSALVASGCTGDQRQAAKRENGGQRKS